MTLGLGALSPASPLWVRPSDYVTAPRKLAQGVVDERAHYVGECGLFAVLENGGSVQHRWARDGRAIEKIRPHVTVRASTGLFGYYAGPKVHIVDTSTLSDPFLARLPVSGVDWRPGHFPRSLPRGYVESLWKGDNRIASPDMRDFYDVVISGTTHNSVYDEYLFAETDAERELSTRNHRAFAAYAVAFLDQALAGQDSPLLRETADENPQSTLRGITP